MRIMYDDIYAANVPTNGDLYAGYDDGHWPDAAALSARFPGKRVVRITVFASDNFGDVLDCEGGDATPAQVPGWLTRRRAAGADPSIYCSEFGVSGIAAVEAACRAAGVHFDRAHWWRANYNGHALLERGESAHQWRDVGPYDSSVVADYWPGIDPPAPPPAPVLTGDDEMQPGLLKDPDSDAQYVGVNGTWYYIPTITDLSWYLNNRVGYASLTATTARAIVASAATKGTSLAMDGPVHPAARLTNAHYDSQGEHMTDTASDTSLPIPLPPPPIVGPWYQSSAFLTWIITTVISIVGGIATLIGHPFDSTIVTAAATSVAWLVAGVTTVVFVHGQQQIHQLQLSLAHDATQQALARHAQYPGSL